MECPKCVSRDITAFKVPMTSWIQCKCKHCEYIWIEDQEEGEDSE